MARRAAADNLIFVQATPTNDPLRKYARHLVGPAEIGELLGVEANTINVWKVRHKDFPSPVRRLKSGDLWDAREIKAWAISTGRSITE